MSQPLVYVDTSVVNEGALEELKEALAQLHEKARLLGTGDMIVQSLHAGFSRFAAS
jgi:hypothetical protein